MTSTDYKAVLNQALEKLSDLAARREEIDTEAAKLQQFIIVTLDMLPEPEQKEMWDKIRKEHAESETKAVSLSDAVRETLHDNPKKWFTSTEMRDALHLNKFDFSGYKSNPLASVSTTLRRLVPQDAHTMEIGGVTAYKFRNTKATKLRVEQIRERRLFANVFGEDKVDEIMKQLYEPQEVNVEGDAYELTDEEINDEVMPASEEKEPEK